MTQTGNNGTATAVTTEGEAAIRLKRLDRVVFEVPIKGTTPLIANRWSEKAKQMMLDSQQTKARTKKDPKDPVANFEAAKYRLPDGREGFPATAFKAAIVHAARLFEGVAQVLVKQTVIVIGEGPDQLVPLDYSDVVMREDMPRNSGGKPDMRYRPQYNNWSALLRIRTIAGQFDQESILTLVDAAGIGGVGDWRPTAPKSATGTFGCFEVVA